MPGNVECRSGAVKLASSGGAANHNHSRDHHLRFPKNLQRLASLLEETHIIPSVRTPELITRGACAPGKLIYFLFGNPEHIAEMMEVVAASGKVPMMNLDLAAGFSRDEAAISFLAHRQVQGIISTHIEPLRAARDFGLFTIKRTFLLDSAALDSGLRSLEQFLPDALELMPAIAAPRMLPNLRQLYPQLPILAGGLITTMREIEDLLQQGITSVSVSDSRLWIA
jgi:glycerol uptake operon antiterminator